MSGLTITTVGELTLLRRISEHRVHTGEDGRLNLSPLQIDALHRLIDHGWVTHVHMSTGRPHILQAGERVLNGELVW